MPELGIFGQHDPLSASSLDPYGYAYQNPIFFADPTGLIGDPINGSGPDDLIGTDAKPIDVGEIVLNAPIRAMMSSITSPNCSFCYVGQGQNLIGHIGIETSYIPRPQPAPYRGPENGQGGGVVMMDSMWDVIGIVAANAKPENREAALGLAAIAVITSGGRAAPGIVKAETSIAKTEGKIIGLGVDADLALYRGTGAIIYKNAGWQQAGLTKVDWGKAIMDKRSFRSSFTDAAENASGIHFNVTSFNPLYHKPGITNFEFNHIINNSHLLQKTTFIQNGNSVIWNGTKFISK